MVLLTNHTKKEIRWGLFNICLPFQNYKLKIQNENTKNFIDPLSKAHQVFMKVSYAADLEILTIYFSC